MQCLDVGDWISGWMVPPCWIPSHVVGVAFLLQLLGAKAGVFGSVLTDSNDGALSFSNLSPIGSVNPCVRHDQVSATKRSLQRDVHMEKRTPNPTPPQVDLHIDSSFSGVSGFQAQQRASTMQTSIKGFESERVCVFVFSMSCCIWRGRKCGTSWQSGPHSPMLRSLHVFSCASCLRIQWP